MLYIRKRIIIKLYDMSHEANEVNTINYLNEHIIKYF